MADERRSNPSEEVRRLYEDAESRTAQAFEEVVSRGSFGELLARMTENAVAVTKIGTDVLDLALRNLRLAGRQDVTRLARQLARTEDKLEMVLQEVERLADQLEVEGRSGGGRAGRRSSANGSTDNAAAAGGGAGAPRGARGAK
ncbi:MAG: hypothetical protein ABSG43_17360 [Solirubrobacteraceae bacterium]